MTSAFFVYRTPIIKSELFALNEKESKGGSGGFTLFGGGTSNDENRRRIKELESQIEELKNKIPSTSTVSSDQFNALQEENDNLKKQIESLNSQLNKRDKPKVIPQKTPESSATKVTPLPEPTISQPNNENPFTQEQLDQWRKEEKEKKKWLEQLLKDENHTPNAIVNDINIFF